MKTFKHVFLSLITIASLSLTGCSSDDDGGSGGDAGKGTIKAKVDGVQFTSLEITSIANKVTAGGVTTLTLQGNTSSQAITMIVIGYEGEGTYQISDSNVFISATYVEPNISDPLNSPTWSAPYQDSGIIGEINVSEETSDNIVGTFNFTAKSSADGSTKVITDGSFDLGFL